VFYRVENFTWDSNRGNGIKITGQPQGNQPSIRGESRLKCQGRWARLAHLSLTFSTIYKYPEMLLGLILSLATVTLSSINFFGLEVIGRHMKAKRQSSYAPFKAPCEVLTMCVFYIDSSMSWKIRATRRQLSMFNYE